MPSQSTILRRIAAGLPRASESTLASRRRTYSKRHHARRATIDAFKVAKGCADCGYNAHPAALEFDHLPGYDKKHDIATIVVSAPVEKLMDEIRKCEVVCANCHRIRTHNRGQRTGRPRKSENKVLE